MNLGSSKSSRVFRGRGAGIIKIIVDNKESAGGVKNKIGIIGLGNMGLAIAEGIKFKFDVFGFDKDPLKIKNLSRIKLYSDLNKLIEDSDAIILAVKPQDFKLLLSEIKVGVSGKLVISIAAGLSISYIENILENVRVVRVMPNLPVRIGKGVSWLSKGKLSDDVDFKFVLRLFGLLGVALILDESMMDKATAFSGSGPGFWAYAMEGKSRSEWKKYTKDVFIPELSRAAVSIGFGERQARVVADKTCRGSLSTVIAWNIDPAELQKQVASKGGTTEAGLAVLQSGGSLALALAAAVKRAGELSLSPERI